MDRRHVVAGVVAFGGLTLLALLVAKWWPYTGKTADLAETGTWEGASLLDTAVEPGLRAGWEFLLTYGEAVWLALVAALLIGAAAEAFLPSARLRRSLSRWGPLHGGLLALPSMMCTCCTAPIVKSMRRCGANNGVAVAYWLGNPVLNPAVLVFLLLVAPWPFAATRVAVGVLLVFGVAALVARLAPTAARTRVSTAGRGAVGTDPGEVSTAGTGMVQASTAGTEPTAGAGGEGFAGALRRFARSLGRSALVLVPEYALLVFAVGAVRGWLFPLGGESGPATATAVAIAVAAVLGLLVVLPTGGEIPVLLALTTAGFSPAVAGVALITLPAVSLPSAVMVGRALSWRVTALVLAAVVVCGLLAGALLTGLAPAASP